MFLLLNRLWFTEGIFCRATGVSLTGIDLSSNLSGVRRKLIFTDSVTFCKMVSYPMSTKTRTKQKFTLTIVF